MMASKKKLLTSGVALGTAAALALGGTFAWQSINQTALNEASDIVNPGGRLHSDQNWISARENNADIYVENFTDPANGGEAIFARVRLSEYMEIVMNQGVTGAEVVETVAGRKLDAEGNAVTDAATAKDAYQYEYAIHYFDQDNATDDFFQWTAGAQDSQRPYYIPTYNLNKDSLLADLNGTYVDSVGGISNRGEEQYTYEEIGQESSKSGYEVYDGDVNTADEMDRADLLDLIENGEEAANYATYAENIVLTADKVDHTAAQVGETRGLISMADWLTLTENTDRYWVYDTDGWVYWSSPIAAGETTGLLLDGFTLSHVMDDTWYYAINVESQFVTADDAGKADGTGFYDTENGTAPSENAETLLRNIGVEIGESTDEPGTDVPGGDDPVVADHKLTLSAGTGAYAVSVSDTRSNKIKLLNFGGGVPTGDIELYTADGETTFGSGDYTYNASTGILTILLQDDDERLNATGTRLTVFIGGVGGDIVWADDGELTLTSNSIDGTMAPLNTGVKVYDTAGNPITELDHVMWTAGESSMVENTDYTFEDGTVTIINDEYAGRPIEIVGLGEVKAVLYVAPAASGGSTEPEGSHTLTTEDFFNGSTIDLSVAWNIIFKSKLDGEYLMDPANLSAVVYKAGETETPVYTFEKGTVKHFYEGENQEVMALDVINAGIEFEEGSNSFDVYVSYTDETGTVTAEKFTTTLNKQAAVMKTDGTATGLVPTHNAVILELDGNATPLAGFSTENSAITQFTVSVPGDSGSETLTFSTEGLMYAWPDETYVGKTSAGRNKCYIMFNYEQSVIAFWDEGGQTYDVTFHVGETDYKITLTAFNED